MRKIRVVLDTNVIVSAHLKATGYERYVLDLVLANKLELLLSWPILEEYKGVLLKPRFSLDRKLVAKSLRTIRERARMVRPVVKLAVASDGADNRFLECASAGHADFVVTGNKRHFPPVWHQINVVTSRELIEWIVPHLQR